MTGICKLCDTETELIEKSHILPKFLLKKQELLKDTKNYHVVEFHNGELTGDDKEQTLPYEGGLLCRSCDNEYLSKLEKAGSKFIEDYRNSKYIRVHQKAILMQDINNHKLFEIRKFFLSIFWRSSIASKNGFQHFNLDKDEEKLLKKSILDPYPADPKIKLILKSMNHKYYDIISNPKTISPQTGSKIHFMIIGTLIVELIINKEEANILPDSFLPPNKIMMLSYTEQESYEILENITGIKQS